ncbi:chitinase [Micromonospora echinospora]|uniref:Chitinase family 18 n=1 Tax=Micromonospora echinospora TaxID=1877 RepID=A0A1C4Z0S6_MICEC|nr:glycosyl hydrolase family 18 protein [Micromonospora echinospora]OZV77151.1 chitinase [Micromonospora echinospora]SCF26191.1 chitinase family 18 [Micromonospora echinospora]
MRRRRLPHLIATSVAGLLIVPAVVAVAGQASSAEVDHAQCRPDGLYRTPGVTVPYCDVYDTEGREVMGADHKRRIIGYFTSWRTGKNGAPAYLANQIPWNKITHINYAFAHVDAANKISVGAPTAPDNPATNMTWPGVAGAEMDPQYSYTGHFNLLNKFKKQHPDVKTLVSVGGWAETGGYIDAGGTRVDAGGFYRMTTTGSNTVNTAGINTFADSVVSFLRTYGFDGVDIDYEYPTSNNKAGHPQDFAQADAKRAGLNASYQVLMRTLREKLDAAAAADGRYYMLTIAAPASGWLLRGMESYQTLQYLDYANIMSYDLHGAWNHFVGPNAALYDDGQDAELAAGGVYGAYQNIGYLNTDWAYHYYRGAMQSGRINIGVPYYTRGWRGVTGGTNGLWGRAALPDQTKCPAGTGGTIGSTVPCGNGAIGIDNIWHDLENGNEVSAGANPMWHAKNLQDGRSGSYLEAYGLTPGTDPTDQLTGTYTRHYSPSLVAPWLWNSQKQVYLSTEDEQSIAAKADYVVAKGIGGIMIWELAGDYAWNPQRGEYFMGNTMTNLIYDRFRAASPYGQRKAGITMPTQTLNVGVTMGGFALGDNNYPINPELRLTNNSGTTIPAGAQLEFDYPTSAPGTLGQQSGWALSVVSTGHTGSNVGGLKGDFHRVRLTVPTAIAPGSFAEVTLNYSLPIAGPSNFTLSFGGQSYALAADHARGAVGPSPTPTATVSPSVTPTGGDNCGGLATWNATTSYSGGSIVAHEGRRYRAKWWTQGENPANSGQWGPWEFQGAC